MNAENLTMNPNEMSSEDLEAVSGGCISTTIFHIPSRYWQGVKDKWARRKPRYPLCYSYMRGYFRYGW